MWYTLYNHSPVNGHGFSLNLFAVISNAVMSIDVMLILLTMFLGIYFKVELLDCVMFLCVFFFLQMCLLMFRLVWNS